MSEETTSNTNQEIKENISLSNLLTFEEYEQSLNSDNRIINEPQSVIVKVEYPPESKETQTSKFVNIAGIVINLILAILTYLLYQQTVLQSQQSAQAVKSAIEAVSEAKNANSISEKKYELAKITFEGNNESTNRTLGLAEKSLNSQLLSIKKAQENFEIENKPYLEINSILISKFEANEPFDGTFDIVNHGNGTVQTTKILLMLNFLDKKQCTDLIKNPKSHFKNYKMHDYKTYISKSIPHTLSFNNGNLGNKGLPFSKDFYNKIMNGTHTIIFSGKIIYINPINMKKRLLSFIIQPIFGKEDEEIRSTWVTIYNENADI